MPKTIIKIKTWTCSDCGYKQDFKPTQANQDLHFNNDRQFPLNNVGANECPSCGLKGMRGKALGLETRPEKKVTVTVMGEEDLEAEITELKAKPEEAIKKGIDISTPVKETAYRNKRLLDIENAIFEARKLEG